MIKSKFKLSKIHNLHLGSDIFILANGPSILAENLNLLKNKIVIGMNASTLLESDFDFVSQYYVVSDTRFITHPQKKIYATEMLNKETKRVFRKELKEFDDISYYSRTSYVPALGKDGFSFNLLQGFYFGCTTTMLALQLAFYLGAKRIFILGCDLKYSGETPRFYKEDIVQEVDRFTGVQIKNIRNAYLCCKDLGIELYSCSETSYLRNYIPFIKFCDAVSDK